MSGRIQIDLWGGDLHQNHVDCRLVDDWPSAFPVIQEAVEAGLLANVLHLDFKVPGERQEEVNAAFRALIGEKP